MSIHGDNQAYPERTQEERTQEPRRRMTPAEMREEIGLRIGRGPEEEHREATARQGWLARLWPRRRNGQDGALRPCCVVAVLILTDRSLALDGLVLEIAEDCLIFRQGSRYIFDRTEAEVVVRFGEHELRGRIIETSAKGYLVELQDLLSPAEVRTLVQVHGLPA
ncbi:MAG: hypothetical protein O9322_06030 [Beijerinckiaceae bacterium]|nr:hypothetical protein [Beijerinckiaceae bacterium]MCZ8299080.1 hypothetical protein [Beijerinckiaceae bacterium]